MTATPVAAHLNSNYRDSYKYTGNCGQALLMNRHGDSAPTCTEEIPSSSLPTTLRNQSLGDLLECTTEFVSAGGERKKEREKNTAATDWSVRYRIKYNKIKLY